MASPGSQGFITTELMIMERICDKLTSILDIYKTM
jgi:hypothetical protein